MKRLAWLFLLAGCTAAPVKLPPPVIVHAAPEVIVVHVPVRAATTIPALSPVPAALLRDSAVVEAQATRYVAGTKSKPANNYTIALLTAKVSHAVSAMKASERHGRYDAKTILAARAKLDALAAYIAATGD